MSRMKAAILDQLSRPRGWLAPLFARLLNRQNRRLNGQAVAVLAPGADERVLEVGFGGGVGLALLRQRQPELRLTGVEISTAMLARARRRFRSDEAAGLLTLVAAGVDALPFEDACFDAVISVNTIYFWPDLRAGLSEIQRVLRPRGRLILGVEAPAQLEPLGFVERGFATPSYDDVATALGRGGFRYIRMLEDPGHRMAVIRAERPGEPG